MNNPPSCAVSQYPLGPPAGALQGTATTGGGVPALPDREGSWWNSGHAPVSLTLLPLDPCTSKCSITPWLLPL